MLPKSQNGCSCGLSMAINGLYKYRKVNTGVAGVEFGRSNGIPHRISPNDSDSDSGQDEYDMLHDVEREKDIFRTKVSRSFIWVRSLIWVKYYMGQVIFQGHLQG